MRNCKWVLILLALLVAQPVFGQDYDPDAVLASLEEVNARVFVTWRNDIEGYDEEALRSRLQTVFELELQAYGIRVSTAAVRTLDLNLTTVSNGPIVAVSHGLELLERAIPTLRLATTLARELPAYEEAVSSRTPDAWPMERRQLVTEILSDVISTTTWKGPMGVAMMGRSGLQGSLESITQEAVQHFASDWLTANPR